MYSKSNRKNPEGSEQLPVKEEIFMTEWLSQNLGTILITILLILIVTGIVIKLIRDKKQGKSTCGGNCAHCNMCAGCHKQERRECMK